MATTGLIARPHRQEVVFWQRPQFDFDTALVAAMFTAGLFILLLPKVGPLFFLSLPVLYVARHPERVQSFAYGVAPILIWPLFCVASGVWSAHPDYSVYFGLLYTITVICALVVGGGVGERALVHGLAIAFSLYAAVAVIDGFREHIFEPGTYGVVAFYGIAGSKNMSGDVAALGVLIGTTLISYSLPRRRYLAALAGAALIVAEAVLLGAAVSTGGTVASLLALALLITLTIVARMPMIGRSLATVSALLFALLLAATRQLWYEPLFASVLRLGHKTQSLTGRDFIWSRADVLRQQHPALGVGYNGFWVPGDLEAEAIWRHFGIVNRTGFNFHNTPIDIMVNVGVVGLAIVGTIFVVYGVVLVVRNLVKPTNIGNFFVALLGYELVRMQYESIGTGVFHYSAFLLFAAFGWAARDARKRRPEWGGSRQRPDRRHEARERARLHAIDQPSPAFAATASIGEPIARA